MTRNEIRSYLRGLDALALPDRDAVLEACAAKAGGALNPADAAEAISAQPRAAGAEMEACVTGPKTKAGAAGAGSAQAAAPGRTARRRAVPALCAVLLLASALTVAAFAAESREYRAAVAFFNENNLATDGLSRSEIREVYRDITTGRFTSEATARLLQKSVMGYEIAQPETTPEELAALWQAQLEASAPAVGYRYSSTERFDEARGLHVLDYSLFERIEDGEPVWSVAFRGLYVDNYVEWNGRILVYGWTPTTSSLQSSPGWFAILSADGAELMRTSTLQNGFRREHIAHILPDGEGFTVFSRGDLEYLCMARYDWTGERTLYAQHEIGNYGVWNAARLGDGYLVQLGSYQADARLVRLSADGALSEYASYSAEDEAYRIVDMCAFGGRVYVSAYAVPRENDEPLGNSHDEIRPVLEKIHASRELFAVDGTGGARFTSETLTELLRGNYTALLLVCDTDSGEPEAFWSVPGGLGAELAVEDGALVWRVERVADAYYSPTTSAFSIAGTSRVFEYRFDADGRLVEERETDELADFRR